MVGRWGRETGKTRIGCLFSLLLFVSAIYYGIQYFEVYFRYYRMQDEVKTQAQFAPTLSDDVIRRRLVARADTLGLPLGTRQWDIRRSANPREILIHAEYDDSVAIELPGYTKVIRFHFTPGARVPL